jgi:anti-sigma regulatory factor (Ser/Thr protein kinase)
LSIRGSASQVDHYRGSDAVPGDRLAVTLPNKPEATALAREWVTGVVDGRLGPSSKYTLGLLITEVVSNSVVHAETEAPLELALIYDSELLVEVIDQGKGFHPTPRAISEEEPGGWGLFLIGELAARWGVEAGPQTCVWFVLTELDH